MTFHAASRLIKGAAHTSLTGHLLVTVAANMFFMSVTVLLAALAANAAPGSGWTYFATSNLFMFVVDVIIGMFQYGLYAIYMNLQYKRPTRTIELFRGFRESSDTILKMQAFLSLVTIAAELPAAALFQYYGFAWQAVPQYIAPAVLFGILAAISISLTYSMCWFLLLDYPELTWRQVLRGSRHLMKGNKRLLLYMYITLIPLYILSVLTFGVGAILVMSYQYAMEAAFYRGLVNAKRARREERASDGTER